MKGMRLGVVGYSARALVEAAAGIATISSLVAVDAFADQDTLDVAECHRVSRWPGDILVCAQRGQCDAWLLAGGLEHHSRLVDQLALDARVLGPTGIQLKQLRSLRAWRQLADGLPGLILPPSSGVLPSESGAAQLFKPLRSSGGLGIIDADPRRAMVRPPLGHGYWQQRIDGRAIGVTMILDHFDERVRIAGATESLTAVDWPGPQPYIYRGNLGPVELTAGQHAAVLELAGRVRDRFGVRGWLQADFIEDASGTLWLLELNPRWTAGMEVLHACAATPADSPLVAHLAAFDVPIADSTPSERGGTTRIPAGRRWARLAKAVVYASAPSQLSPAQRSQLQALRHWQPLAGGYWSIADVPPMAGDQPLDIGAGEPLLTVRFALANVNGPWSQTRQDMLNGLTLARERLAQTYRV